MRGVCSTHAERPSSRDVGRVERRRRPASIWAATSVAAALLLVAGGSARGQATSPASDSTPPQSDTGFISIGHFPRFESDPYIKRRTFSAEPTFTDKETDQEWQLALKYGAPIDGGLRWSWQLSVPFEIVDTPGKPSAAGLSDVSLTVNHTYGGALRQALSLQLTANTATNQTLGDDQWEIEPTYTLGGWLAPWFSSGLLLSWTYGFWVDSSKTREDVIQPRMIFGFHPDERLDLTLDLRPRFDLTRDEFYSTLMVLASRPLGSGFSGQAGFEFPLSQLAAKRVENSRVYLDFSHGW